jgi:hypothetical protein
MSSQGNPSTSNEGSGAGSSASSPSPGKGGKFLEMMQKRILAEQQHQQPLPPSSTGIEQNPQGHPQNLSNPQVSMGDAMIQPQLQQPPPAPGPQATLDPTSTKHSPISRPKGKDFAAMSSRGPIPNMSSQIQPSQMQQQQQIPPSPPPTGKPKGKDFGAMASRMPLPTPMAAAVQSQPSIVQSSSSKDQAAQVARAVQMQAEARAAAGLPPLTKPSKFFRNCCSTVAFHRFHVMIVRQRFVYSDAPFFDRIYSCNVSNYVSFKHTKSTSKYATSAAATATATSAICRDGKHATSSPAEPPNSAAAATTTTASPIASVESSICFLWTPTISTTAPEPTTLFFPSQSNVWERNGPDARPAISITKYQYQQQ